MQKVTITYTTEDEAISITVNRPDTADELCDVFRSLMGALRFHTDTIEQYLGEQYE